MSKKLWFFLALWVVVSFWIVSCSGSNSPPVDQDGNVVITPQPPINQLPPLPNPCPMDYEGCATPTPTPVPQVPYIGDRTFAKWLTLFVTDGSHFGQKFDTHSLTIQFGDLSYRGANVIGLCETGCTHCPRVTISPTWWNSHSDAYKEMLMHHELGHCLLQRPHLATKVGGWPVSLMYPAIFSQSQFLNNKAKYLTELFTEAMSNTQEEQTFVCGE